MATYDYIIVGAGSAGCVLAHRLSEDEDARVLLVEAGGEDRRQEIHIPAAFSKLFKTEQDWNFTTAPQPCMNGRRLYWPRGKMLGGSSSLNAMIYMRGHRADYDGWAAQGNPGWRYAQVLPYFKKLEHYERGASKYHGAGGPLNVADLRDPSPFARAFVRAGIEVGLPFNPDFNGARQEGVGLHQVTQKGGQRHSTATAYLKTVRHRANLTILTGAHVTRVLLEGRRAAGIAYERGGQQHTVRAAREVILSAGAIGSPQLLMLSGIGPAAHLEAHGLSVAHDLPGVGRNLQDHLVAGVMHRCTAPTPLTSAESWVNLARYVAGRRGPLTSNVAEAGAFVRTRPGLEAPDLQFHFAPVAYQNHGLEPITEDALSLGATLIQPKSRGHIALRSPDPYDAPVIQPHYLSDPEEADLRVLLDGLKRARRIFAARALAPHVGEELLPGPVFSGEGEAGLRAYVRERAETIYHPVGTCKMGTGPEAVVDPELRVRGLEGLRVADASVMPTIVRGNTNVPVIMIAEKAADLIRRRTPRRLTETAEAPA